MGRRIVLEDELAVALDLDQGVRGEDVVREQGGAAVIGDGEAEQPVVGEGVIFPDEGFRQFPVEGRVKDLAHADHHVAAHVRNDPQVVGHIQLRLARLELQLAIAGQGQLFKKLN